MEKKKKPTRKELLAEVRRLKLQIKTILSIKVELRGNKEEYKGISAAQLHGYLREHGWEPLKKDLRGWELIRGPKEDVGLVYQTIDRDGYTDHPQRIAEMIELCGRIEKRSPIAVMLDMQAVKTNTLDKMVDAISKDD